MKMAEKKVQENPNKLDLFIENSIKMCIAHSENIFFFLSK